MVGPGQTGRCESGCRAPPGPVQARPGDRGGGTRRGPHRRLGNLRLVSSWSLREGRGDRAWARGRLGAPSPLKDGGTAAASRAERPGSRDSAGRGAGTLLLGRGGGKAGVLGTPQVAVCAWRRDWGCPRPRETSCGPTALPRATPWTRRDRAPVHRDSRRQHAWNQGLPCPLVPTPARRRRHCRHRRGAPSAPCHPFRPHARAHLSVRPGPTANPTSGLQPSGAFVHPTWV